MFIGSYVRLRKNIFVTALYVIKSFHVLVLGFWDQVYTVLFIVCYFINDIICFHLCNSNMWQIIPGILKSNVLCAQIIWSSHYN